MTNQRKENEQSHRKKHYYLKNEACKPRVSRSKDADEDEWNPEPAELRDGETRDDDNTHARRNAEQKRIIREALEERDEEKELVTDGGQPIDFEKHADELPEHGVRKRSGYSVRIHRIDEDADELEPACSHNRFADAGFKREHIASVISFERFELCRSGECFGDLEDDAESEPEQPVATDGGVSIEIERVELDDVGIGDRVSVEYRREDHEPDVFDGVVVDVDESDFPERDHVSIDVHGDDDRTYRVLFGGGVAIVTDEHDYNPTVGYCADVLREREIETDGGRDISSDGRDRPDPEDDPFACSVCGCYLGEVQRIRGDDYCDPCSRESGSKPPIRRCMGCGRDYPQEDMEGVDVSPPDEYYPDIRYLCPGCSDDGGQSIEDDEIVTDGGRDTSTGDKARWYPVVGRCPECDEKHEYEMGRECPDCGTELVVIP